jgi:CheY-like chemotaxis protein
MIVRTAKYGFRPRLLLGYADPAHAALCARHFRRLGWEVHLSGSGPETRRLAEALAPEVVILDVDLPEESGWLTAAKLRFDRPKQKVFLVGPERTPTCDLFATFVGAAGFFARAEESGMLAEEIQGARVPA